MEFLKEMETGQIVAAVTVILALCGTLVQLKNVIRHLHSPEYRDRLLNRLALVIIGCALYGASLQANPRNPFVQEYSFDVSEIPAYESSAYTVLNQNIPSFTEEEREMDTFEAYGEMDLLGRCTAASALIGPESMPEAERGSIGMIRPSGWQLAKYDFIDGQYLFNRCHLIGYQLTGQNANEKNLITGTRYMNVEGMEPFENQTAWYIRRTGNHVLYRVTPVFEGTDLVAKGVRMEAWSVEDHGAGICFNIFCYNVQPGVVIDYADGSNHAA